MDLVQYNNKKVIVKDVDDQVFKGICVFEDKEMFDEMEDGIAVKTGFRWVKIFENEIKSIEQL